MSVYLNNSYRAIGCPRCGQEVRVDRRGDGFRFSCRGGCTDNEVAFALDPAVMLELAANNGNGAAKGRRLALVQAAKVQPLAIRWTWRERIPDGAVTLLVGREGTGKSTLSALLTADATLGRLAGHLDGQPADVIVATLEDPAASVAVPRLIAAGADLERVHFLQLGGDETEPMAIPDDLAAIETEVEQVGARLLVIDPLVATLPEKINGHRDQHVRRALAPLVDMADRLKVAVVPVLHFNKAAGSDALLRVGGSIAFVAAARSVLAFGYDPDDPDGEAGNQRILAHPKSNFGPKQRAIRYRVDGHDFDRNGTTISTSRLAFVEECDVVASEFFGSRDPDERSKEEEARDWLIGHLAGEWQLGADVKEDGERKKHTPRTLQRAFHKMVDDDEAELKKEGFPPRSYWRLAVRANPIGANTDGANAESGAKPVAEPNPDPTALHWRQATVFGANGGPDAAAARIREEVRTAQCSCLRPSEVMSDGCCGRCYGTVPAAWRT
jgi:putative DNA primase/helicase